MKTLLAAIIGLAIVAVANPAPASVVAITTSIPAKSVADDADHATVPLNAPVDVDGNPPDVGRPDRLLESIRRGR